MTLSYYCTGCWHYSKYIQGTWQKMLQRYIAPSFMKNECGNEIEVKNINFSTQLNKGFLLSDK